MTTPQNISLLDYFAASALQGMLAYSYVNPQRGNYHENCTFEGAAYDAYSYARAMLKARSDYEDSSQQDDSPTPIGNCPRCLAPVYTDEGFCGGCKP